MAPKALTIAGSDSGGGAGIQADLKTFAALGVYGCSAITAVTAQNTLGVSAVEPMDPAIVGAQIDAVMSDIGAGAVKTGMLCSAPIIEEVADRMREHAVGRLVVDPVIQSSSGHSLLSDDGIATLRERLLPLALVVTPNLAEAQVLTGRAVANETEMREAAKAIADMGPRAVVVKGGHLAGDAVDILFDGHDFHLLHAERIASPHTHGTGCTFSAAITAGLARGLQLTQAVTEAKAFVTEAIRHGYAIGSGTSPVNQLFPNAG